jgi:hypothetical protein
MRQTKTIIIAHARGTGDIVRKQSSQSAGEPSHSIPPLAQKRQTLLRGTQVYWSGRAGAGAIIVASDTAGCFYNTGQRRSETLIHGQCEEAARKEIGDESKFDYRRFTISN